VCGEAGGGGDWLHVEHSEGGAGHEDGGLHLLGGVAAVEVAGQVLLRDGHGRALLGGQVQ